MIQIEDFKIPFVPIFFIAALFGIAYLYFTARHRERIAMIKNGVEASSIRDMKKAKANTLKNAMLLIGIAIGILVGHWITIYFKIEDNPVYYFAMIFLFGGMSLLLNYYLTKNKNS